MSIIVTVIIVSKQFGRLGNRLYVFAHQIAASIENGHKLLNPSFFDYANEFEGTLLNPLCAYPPSRLKVALHIRARFILYRLFLAFTGFLEKRKAKGKVFRSIVVLDKVPDTVILEALDPDFAAQAHSKTVFTNGWRISDLEAVKRHKAEIVQYLVPIKKYRDEVERTMTLARSDADIVVGVHIRQGDLRKLNHPNYILFESSEYADFMRHASTLFPDKRVVFIICAEEKQDFDLYTGLKVVPGPGSVLGDLYALAACDYILGSPSTFSNWASFYGDVPTCQVTKKDPGFSLADFVLLDLSYEFYTA